MKLSFLVAQYEFLGFTKRQAVREIVASRNSTRAPGRGMKAINRTRFAKVNNVVGLVTDNCEFQLADGSIMALPTGKYAVPSLAEIRAFFERRRAYRELLIDYFDRNNRD